MNERLQNGKIYGNNDVEVYFDNFFSSFAAMSFLKSKNVKATGTVRKNRTEKCPIEEKALINKGDFDFMSSEGIVAVGWKDNSTVCLLSNFDLVHPVSSAQCYSRQAKGKVSLPMPKLISRYNQFMGGVDVFDSRIQLYHMCFQGKKWYWPIMAWIFETFMSNAFLIHRATIENGNSPIDQLSFRRIVARHLLSSTTKRLLSKKRRVSNPAHHVHKIGVMTKRRRCQMSSCPKRQVNGAGAQVIHFCETCDFPCHVECFNSHMYA